MSKNLQNLDGASVQAGRKGLKDLDPRKWYISTEDGDTYGPYSNQSQAGDDGDAAFRGTTDFVVERGDKVRDSVLDPKSFESKCLRASKAQWARREQ